MPRQFIVAETNYAALMREWSVFNKAPKLLVIAEQEEGNEHSTVIAIVAMPELSGDAEKVLKKWQQDANLLAAAPDLLASCEECLMHLDWAFGLNPEPGPNFYKVAKMRAAIAKAKGEPSVDP